MNVVQEYLECNCKDIVSYWSYCHDLVIDALKWAGVQYKDKTFRMLVIESAEMHPMFPAINLKECMPESLREENHVGWAFHVVLFDGKNIHDGWFNKTIGLKEYLKEMFPYEKLFLLTCGPIQKVVDIREPNTNEEELTMEGVGAAC